MCLRALRPDMSIAMVSSSVCGADCTNEVSQKSRSKVAFLKNEHIRPGLLCSVVAK